MIFRVFPSCKIIIKLLMSFIFLSICSYSYSQTAVPRYPINGDRVSANPKFTAIETSLVPGVLYNVVVSEQPRGGGAGVDQYIDFWTKENVPASSLMDTNINRLGWDSTWVRKTRNGSYTGTPVVVTNATPSSLINGKTYYWHIYGQNGTKSVESTFAVIDAARPVPIHISPADGATIYTSTQNPCFSWSMSNASGFSGYTIMVSTTPDFPTTRWQYQITSITTTSVCWNNGSGWSQKGTTPPAVAGPLQNGTTYYWRVLASYTDAAITGRDFVGRSFVYRASSSSAASSSVISSSRSSSSATISSSLRSSSSSSTSSVDIPYIKPESPVTAVGTTPYTANVDHKGEAVISIPIQIAPGINGMHPQLGLVYTSGGTTAKIQNQTAGGFLGFGWGLTGISSIDRCTVGKPNVMDYIAPSNKALGKQTMRPKLKYDDTDNLCLDGEQLVLVSGTHLRNGAVYRTYKESYRLITYQEFYDSEAKANAFRFEVRNPNGSIAIYGGNAAARVQKQITYLGALTPVFTWGITTETDSFANQIIYRYRKWEAFSYQANKQRLFPTSISYPGGNINFGYVELNTHWPSRPQSEVLEDDGEAAGPDRWRWSHDSGDQLVSIRTEARQYYITGSGQTRTELRRHGLKPSAIQECGSNIYMQYDQCLTPIKLEWLTRTTAYPEFPQVTSKYYEVGFLGGIVDSLGRKTEFQYDKIYGAYSTNPRNKFSEYPLPLPSLPKLTGIYDRTNGDQDADNLNEVGFVVVQFKNATGVSSDPYTLHYQYRASGTMSNLGKGFLGFPAVRVEDKPRGVVSYKIYELDKSPYGPVGIVGETSAIHKYTGIYGTGEKPISKKEFRYSIKTLTHNNGAKTYLPIVDQITSLNYENGLFLGANIKTNNYEMLGTTVSKITSNTKVGSKLNPLSHTPQYFCDNAPHTLDTSSVKSEKVSSTSLGSYTGATDWRVGFTSEQIESLYNGAVGSAQASDVKTKRIVYGLKAGTTLVQSETHFPNDAENEKLIEYTYNAKGQQETVTVSGKNLETRTTQVLDYLPDSTYPQRTLNPLGHQTTVSDVDIRFNLPRRVTDANGLSTVTTYDAFARPAQITDKNGVTTVTTYYSCKVNYCATVPGKLQSIQPVYYMEVTSPVAPKVREYVDSLGRVIRTEKQGFTNESIYVDVQFDEFGRVYKTSVPYKAGSTAYYETRSYDNRLDRLTEITRADGSSILTAYSTENIQANEPWLKVTTTDAVRSSDALSVFPRRKVNYFNSAGDLVRVIDAEGTVQSTNTQYKYDALGNVVQTLVDGGIDGTSVSSAIYDNAGNQVSLTDPNAGTVLSKYTALGELRLVTDAEAKTTTYGYDKLGRMNLRSNMDGKFNWYYDNPGAKGMLAYEHDDRGYSKSYNYVNARLDNMVTDINISGQPARRFTETVKYDSYWRVQKTTAPSGFAVTHRYNSYGYVTGFSYGDNLYSLWDISRQSALGIEEETLLGAKTVRTFDPKSGRLESLQSSQGGAKYQDARYFWYSNASLERRDNLLKNLSDVFGYDDHDRLNVTSTKNISTWVNQRTINQQYSNLGNIKSNISTNNADISTNNYQYGTTQNAGPHAVSSVLIGGVAHQIYYNRNGAITQYDASGSSNDKFIAYNANNQPTNITLGVSLTDANPKARDEFRYAADGGLCYKKSTYNQNGILRVEHTYYVGNYEVTFYDANASLLKSEKTKVGRLLVTHNTPVSGATTETLQAMHLDYQGSIDAISNSTNLTLMAFEPFGARRSTDLLSNITTTQLTDLLGKQDKHTAEGYTGHKMLDRTGFIHMNGRVYDPVLGRFLSPDPIVQAPGNSQSWNRYSYVFNNPMKYTDPSGYEADDDDVEEVLVTPRDGCDEICQRKGYTTWYYTNVTAIDAANARWENWGGRMYNVLSDQGRLLYEAAQGLAVSNASIQAAVAGGGSKTNSNNILGALSGTYSQSSFWDNPGAYLPSVPQGVMDFAAGMGDTILFGFGDNIRAYFDIDGGVNMSSDSYSYGEWAGVLITSATGAYGGLRAAGTKGFAKEFSHWIPNRMGGPRTRLNGNYVPIKTHALSDPHRYRMMSRAWKEANPPMGPFMSQWVRTPNVYKGLAAGSVYGAIGSMQGDY